MPGMHGKGFGASFSFSAGVSMGSELVLSSLIRFDVGARDALYGPFERGGNLSSIGLRASVLFTFFPMEGNTLQTKEADGGG
jgi:hypothetical protein